MAPSSAPVSFPSTPFFEAYLFQAPWVLMGALLALGITGMILLNARGRAGTGLAVLGAAALLAAGAWVTSRAVETTAERLQARTEALIEAAARGDGEVVAEFLEAGANIEASPWAEARGRAAIRDLVNTRVKGYALRSWSLSGLRSAIDGDSAARTLVRVSVEPEATRLPYASWWMFTWRRDEQGAWHVWTIRLLEGDSGGAWR